MILAAAALLALQSSPYSVQLVASPANPYYPQGVALNDNSQVLYCMDSAHDGDLPTTYLWSNGTAVQLVAPNSDENETHYPSTVGLSNDGVVVGMIMHTTLDRQRSRSTPFKWTAAQGWQELTANGSFFEPLAINAHNDVVGISHNPETAFLGVLSTTQGFVPVRSLEMEEAPLGGLMNRDEYLATLNDKGDVAYVQISYVAPSAELAFRKLPDAQQSDVLQLPPYVPSSKPGSDPTSYVAAVNNAGWMVGGVDMHPDRPTYASAWQPARSVNDSIGAVWSPDNTFYSIGAGYRATDINDAAQVIGYQLEQTNHWIHAKHAIIYDTAHGVRYLDSMVPPGSPALERAISINSKGEILCSGVDTALYLLKPTA